MSLMEFHANHSNMESNLIATPSLTVGTSVVASATPNTKGAWAQMIAATEQDAYGFSLLINNSAVGGLVRNGLLDIGIGGAGSEVELVSNLLDSSSLASIMFFPLFIPAGSRISARRQNTAANASARIGIFLHGRPSNRLWPLFHGCEVFGTDTAASNGTDITAGNSGAESAWVSIGAPTSHIIKALYPRWQNDSVITSYSDLAYHFEIGYSSTAIAEYMLGTATTESINGPYPSVPFFTNIPVGTQLQMRGECGGTAQRLQACLVGFY